MVKSKTKEFLVPWTKEGVPWNCDKEATRTNYFDYVKRRYINEPISWKPNDPFKAAFEVKRFTGSTDSTQIILQHTETEQTFYIRDKDFLEALKKSACTYGVLLGEWKFKRTVGTYYGLKFVG